MIAQLLGQTTSTGTYPPSSSTRLLDVDLAGPRGGSLGNEDTQDTVLEAGLDSILINPSWEGKAAVKLSDRTLRNPVLRLGGFVLLGDLLLVGLLGNFVVGLGGIVLDGGLVTELLLLRSFCALDEALWTLAFLADMLMATGDGQGVVIGPLDVDVFLVDAGKLAMQFVAFIRLLDVELGSEGADVVEFAVNVAESCLVEFIEESEHGRHLLSETWEERHCCWCVVEVSNRYRLRDAVELLRDSSDCCAQWLHRRLVVVLVVLMMDSKGCLEGYIYSR
jgi:hypothetical protein